MSKVNVKTASVIDYNPVGAVIELPKKTAEKLAVKGYVEILGKVKEKQVVNKPVKEESVVEKPVTKDKPSKESKPKKTTKDKK